MNKVIEVNDGVRPTPYAFGSRPGSKAQGLPLVCVSAGDRISEPRGATAGIRSHQVRYGPACFGEYLITTYRGGSQGNERLAMVRKSRIASSREQCCDE
jgi:hypothetical protein